MGNWDESKHPRNPAGTSAGGEFAGGGTHSKTGDPSTDRTLSSMAFKREVKNMGVHIDTVSDVTGKESLFIHFDDANKQQEKQIAKLAKQYKMKISLADKGAIFD